MPVFLNLHARLTQQTAGIMIYRIPLVARAIVECQSLLVRCTRRFHFDKGLAVMGWPILRSVPGLRVSVGRNFMMISASSFSAVGVSHPCVINALRAGAEITIGNDVGISGASICACTSVIIGDRVMLGADTVITDTDFHVVNTAQRRYIREGIPSSPVVIEDDVFIGMRSIVLKGVRIGEGSVVGAGSVVTRDIPPYAIAAGQPARVVGSVER